MEQSEFDNEMIFELKNQLRILGDKLIFQSSEKEKREAELLIITSEIDIQSDEKIKLAAELYIANIEFIFLNSEKDKLAEELIVANIKMAYQNEEKEKRAVELVIANTELIFQNGEKEKRAKELIIANIEMAYQNDEKMKRADELLVANVELNFQNGEKEKRAKELIIANIELAYQNDEKEKRADELLIANKELVYQNVEQVKRIAEILQLRETIIYNERQLFEKTLVAISDGVISTDINMNVLFMNKASEKLTGWTKNEAIGKPIYSIFNIINEYTRNNDENIIEYVIRSKNSHNFDNDTILVSKDGSERLIEDNAAPILSKTNNVVGVVVVFRDSSEKREHLRKIEYLNLHDDLTGLYNRRFFEEELKRLDTDRNYPLSIIMGDTNGLKLINDSFGHKVGDEMLTKTANALKNGCRKDEIIARIGGDEFALILPNANSTDTVNVIERIKDNLKDENVNGLDVSVSFGYGIKTDINQSISKILKDSEDNMYKQKLFETTSMRSKTIDLILKTLFEKNSREMNHSKRVSELCVLIAEKLEFSQDHISLMKLAGLMHDIGKIGIEDIILNKIGRLTEHEYAQIKKHPEIGFRILNSVNEFTEIANFVYQHHEKWDGTGYPQGLKGNEISIEARIISIADAYDAMTSQRTYRKALSQEEAVIEIRRCCGTQFDSTIGEAFIQKIIEISSIETNSKLS